MQNNKNNKIHYASEFFFAKFQDLDQ